MPNYCDFDGRIKAIDSPMFKESKKARIRKFIDWMNAEYRYSGENPDIYLEVEGKKIPVEHHLGWRVFECNADLDWLEEIPDENDPCLDFFGYCAWSVYSCMLEGPFTYYSDNHKENIEKYGKDFSLTLPMACKELGLEVEIFSSEPGMCFAEHYHVSANGELLTEDETDYVEHYIEECETYEDFSKEWIEKGKKCSVSKKDFDKAKADGETFLTECKWLSTGEWPFSVA